MSEFVEHCWSVVSERGLEANGLSYQRALELMHRLIRKNIHGTCIVSDAAGRRLAHGTPLEVK